MGVNRGEEKENQRESVTAESGRAPLRVRLAQISALRIAHAQCTDMNRYDSKIP